jgi:cytochrome bd-type quinol oxidase subunit 2
LSSQIRRSALNNAASKDRHVFGWIFIALGALFFLAGLAMAICILLAGRSLTGRKRSWFAFVVSCVECLFFPFGTILGVFPIIVLSRESVKALFSAETAQVPG